MAGSQASADLAEMRPEIQQQQQQGPLGAGDIFFNQTKGEPMDLAFRMLKEVMV